MKRWLGIAFLLAPLTACVARSTLQEQIAKTEEVQRELMSAQSKLDQVYNTDFKEKKELEDDRVRLAAIDANEAKLREQIQKDEQQIAELKKTNADLRVAAEGRKGDVVRQLADMIQERDDLRKQLAQEVDTNTTLKLRLRELRSVAGNPAMP